MNRIQRRKVKLKRRWTFVYAVASVLTLGVLAVLINGAFQQTTWSLAWFGAWIYVAFQVASLVVHVRGTLRNHREYEELTERYTEASRGGGHAS